MLKIEINDLWKCGEISEDNVVILNKEIKVKK